MSGIKPSLTLPASSLRSPVQSEDGGTPVLNKSVSFIDVSGKITSKYSSSSEESMYESDGDGSANLIKRNTTISTENDNFERKPTRIGSFLKRKSTTSSGSSFSFRIRNSLSIVNRNKTLKKLLDTKTVGFAGGVTLLINGILGPGLIPTPETFSQAGFLIPTLTFLFFAVFSTICAQFIIEAMQSIPGNKHFQGTVEFSTLINFYFGKKMHFFGQVILYLALQSANISSIIYSAQTMDNFIINFFKKSCGVAINRGNSMFSYYCVDKMAEENSPFGDQFMLVTLGYIVTFIFIFPVGFIKLQDNINLQIISFLITMCVFVVWFILFYITGFHPSYVPMVSSNFQEVVGVVMFNFAFVTTIPSWINIKKKEVSVQKSLWTSTITSVVLYVIIGYSTAITFKPQGTLNILSQLSSLNFIGRITTYIFSIAILMVSIPVFSIIVRNNLVQNKICGFKTATFFSHVLPWICVLPFQTGTLINDVINWTSLFFVSTANFIIPIIIYLKCLKFKEELKENHYFNPRQRELLKTIHWQSKTIQGFIDSYPTIKEPNLNKKQKEKIDEEEVINNTTINANNTEQKVEHKEKIYDNKNNTSSQNLNVYTNEPPDIYLYKPSNNPNSPLYTGNDSNNEDGKTNSTTTNNLLIPPPPATLPPPSPDTSFSHRPTVLGTLPMHPLFISNYYKGIPDWIPCSPKTFAKICLYIITFIVVAVIGLNIYQVASPSTSLNVDNSNNALADLPRSDKVVNDPSQTYVGNNELYNKENNDNTVDSTYNSNSKKDKTDNKSIYNNINYKSKENDYEYNTKGNYDDPSSHKSTELDIPIVENDDPDEGEPIIPEDPEDPGNGEIDIGDGDIGDGDIVDGDIVDGDIGNDKGIDGGDGGDEFEYAVDDPLAFDENGNIIYN